MRLEPHWRDEDGLRLPMLLWRPGPGYRMISSAILGGGIGPRDWVLNAQVRAAYHRMDPAAHLGELAATLDLPSGAPGGGGGVGMLTAAQVTDVEQRDEKGVHAAATVGLRVPTWAAAPDGTADPELAPMCQDGAGPQGRPGTINVIVCVPVPLTDAALVNAVVTATEAKTQAVIEAGYRGTGTASDAICIAAPAGCAGQQPEPFAGPRSEWGGRIARTVHAVVLAGARSYRPTS